VVSPPRRRLSSHISHHESATLLAQRAESAPQCDSPNLKRPNFNSMRDSGRRGRDATQNQLGSRRFNARDGCPYLRVGFDCGDSHRPLAAILNRLLLFCTSVESDNTASRCVRRRSCPQPNSHFAGVDDHVPSRPLACINLSPKVGVTEINDGLPAARLT
jgi:hypothetical protein